MDGATISRPTVKVAVRVTLPTVALIDGVLKPTLRKTPVNILAADGESMLCELGMPVCSLADVEFPWTLDVQQKVPVPLSRDVVPMSYLYRLIGSVLEQAAMDGHALLTDEQQGAGFVRDALEWVREPEALATTVKSLYGENAVRQSSDPIANAKAAAAGATIIPGRWFHASTRSRLGRAGIMPTSQERFGGAGSVPGLTPEVRATVCQACGGTGLV